MKSNSIWSLNKKGFTLIELLVVVSIVGVLSSAAMAPFNEARKKGRDAKRVTELKSIQSSLQLYADDNGGCYPDGSWLIYYFGELSSTNYKYITKALYDKMINENNYSSSPTDIPTRWTAAAPYGYRGVGDTAECLNSLSRPGIDPAYQLFVELETHSNALNGDSDANMSNIGSTSYKHGLDFSGVAFEACTDGSVGNWDCVYDLSN